MKKKEKYSSLRSTLREQKTLPPKSVFLPRIFSCGDGIRWFLTIEIGTNILDPRFHTGSPLLKMLGWILLLPRGSEAVRATTGVAKLFHTHSDGEASTHRGYNRRGVKVVQRSEGGGGGGERGGGDLETAHRRLRPVQPAFPFANKRMASVSSCVVG